MRALLKKRIDSAQAFIDQYENLAAYRAREHKVDGYICGHIHHWQMRHCEDALYINDGDWVEHCSALFETEQGTFQIWQWADSQKLLVCESNITKSDEIRASQLVNTML